MTFRAIYSTQDLFIGHKYVLLVGLHLNDRFSSSGFAKDGVTYQLISLRCASLLTGQNHVTC